MVDWIEGDTYKRPLVPDSLSSEVQEWYCRKNAHLVRNRPFDAVFFSAALAAELERGFRAAAPLYGFLTEVGSADG